MLVLAAQSTRLDCGMTSTAYLAALRGVFGLVGGSIGAVGAV